MLLIHQLLGGESWECSRLHPGGSARVPSWMAGICRGYIRHEESIIDPINVGHEVKCLNRGVLRDVRQLIDLQQADFLWSAPVGRSKIWLIPLSMAKWRRPIQRANSSLLILPEGGWSRSSCSTACRRSASTLRIKSEYLLLGKSRRCPCKSSTLSMSALFATTIETHRHSSQHPTIWAVKKLFLGWQDWQHGID